MQMIRIIIATIVILGWGGSAVRADCVVIDQLDKLYILQIRLASNPDTALFQNDIRQLRTIAGGLSERTAMQAVDGNTLVGKGADVVRFLRQTQSLLQRASMDDPLSVKPHFTPITRSTLIKISDHLHDLRCTDEQIEVAQAAAAENPTSSTSDAEDLEAVAAAIRQFAEELIAPRNIFMLVATVIAGIFLGPLVRRWLIMRKRRAKRHNTNHAVRYEYKGVEAKGALIDINCYGTKLRHSGDEALVKGAQISIGIEGAETPGAIVWSNTHYSGVQFKAIISLAQVDFVRFTE